jgi:chromosome partitioning protein
MTDRTRSDAPRNRLAVVNQKGGVGKTTTAVNLAAALAQRGRRVLLVDMDPQGNASSGLGHPTRTVETSVYRVLLGEATMKEILLPCPVEGLFLAPATQDLVAAEIELVDEPDRATRLRSAIDALLTEQSFDDVLIDCPPSLGLLTVNALVAANEVLVPLQCEYYALEGLTHLMSTIERVRAGLHPTLGVKGLVLTMFDARNNLAHQVAAEVRKHFRVFDAVIPRNVRLSEAPSHGKPVTLYDATSKGSVAYQQLAAELVAEVSP